MAYTRSLFNGPLNLKLIELVRDNPVLYDPSHPKYSCLEDKQLAWKNIGEILQRPPAEFAGIQCQIQFGDYHEEKHKPGFIENLSEYLPEQYCSSWSIEKKILKEYSTHTGLNELEAKHLYTKTARALPTYGVTFFLVKEKQKGKKKLVPRLLGINADAILRLDETTKEVIQTWPLTHVKTYHAGKGETFTLNFGDYTDKEYSVKTRDAFRIRDILEGYIDLIRKRMLAQYNMAATDYGYVGQDNISYGQASVVQHISNNPSKIVEHTFVGPSKIVEYAPGQVASHGTQMVTTQQLLIEEMKNKQGQGVMQKAEVGMRQDMGVPFTRRLNRLNSNSVKVVNLLSKEPSQAQISDAQKIVDDMKADMPSIRDGVNATIAKQTSEEEKKKLQDQINELDELMKSLSQYTSPDSLNVSEAEDAAKRLATLGTEMYFGIAPETKRRSGLLNRSRQSFIADEKTEKNLRRASFIAASATANHALDSAAELAHEGYKGPALSPQEVEELERAAVDKIGKVNAAIAHYILAHSDPKNIDYASAVTSLNTIHELMPDLARDARALASVKDGKDRSALVNDIEELCAAAKHVCSLSGVDDADKLQEASAKYADVSGRLVYVFGKRRAKPRADKENEILELADDVVNKTSALLQSTQHLTNMAVTEPAAGDVHEAGAKTAAAAKNLHAQAVLNAPTIDEPHCQSALTAASEALSSSAQHLAATWKPLAEHPSRHILGEKLHHQTMDLAKALDKLTDSYGSLSDSKCEDGKAGKPADEAQRLKFINSLSKVGGDWKAAEDSINKPLSSSVSAAEASDAQQRLANRLAQLNAALAALLNATSDRENPDYGTAEAAIATINELMPELLKDSKIASANQDEASKAGLLDDVKALCDATKNVCASAYGTDPEALNEALVQLTNSSGKLTYVCNRRANPDRESKIIDATSAACAQAGALLSGVQQLEQVAGGEVGEKLDTRGAALAEAAQALLTAAQITAATISDPRCQSTLSSAIDKVSSAGKVLEDTWSPLKGNPELEPRLLALKAARRELEKQLERLRAACQIPDNEVQSTQQLQTSDMQSFEPQTGWKEGQSTTDGTQEPHKLKFIATMRVAKDKLADAQKELDKPTMPAKGSDTGAVQQRLTQGLEQLNAAIAALLAATADRENPDCATAEQAADTISKLMPQLIKDTKTVSATMDEPARAAMLAEIKALCDASQGICASAYGSDATQQNVNDAVAKFADASGKLVFVVNPRKSLQKKDEVVKLAGAACGDTSELLAGVQRLAKSVGGPQGKKLDEQGGKLATAAQNMLQSAQILSASLPSSQCQEALLSSVNNVSQEAEQLAASVAPLQKDPTHGAAAKETLAALQRLNDRLGVLAAACRTPDGSEDPSQEQKKLHFINTVKGARGKWADAEKELKKPVTPARGADVAAIQSRLSDRLAALNAAVADLLAATADRDKPSYADAEKAVKTISELLPHVVQDTKAVCASKDEPARAAMLAEVKALCDASESICASSYGNDTQGLNDAVSKFADASGKLVFVANPRKTPHKRNEVVQLAGAACADTSALLGGVQNLAQGVGGTQGRALDEQGGKLAAAAQNMLQSAQILSPSLPSRECQKSLLSSVDSVSQEAQKLAMNVAPLQKDPTHGPTAKETVAALQQLENKLHALGAACKTPDSSGQDPAQEQQKLQFVKTVEATKGKWADAQKELKKPVTPARGADVDAIQSRLSDRLAALDAAVAALLAATADRDKPSYADAEKAVKTISELLPHVVQDTKAVCASKEAPARAAMLAEVKALCDASESICASSYGNDSQGLNDAVSKFADASGKLVFVVNPRKSPQKRNEVVQLAGAACGDTSALLAGVQNLAKGVGGTRGRELDEQGGKLAAAAQNMLQSVQILSPSLPSRECQEAILSSVDSVSQEAQKLATSVVPLQKDPTHGPTAKDTVAALQRLENKLQALGAACKTPDSSVQDPAQEQQKLQFVKTVEATKGKWADAQKELKKPMTPARGADVAAIQSRLSDRLAALNAAVTALLAATADCDKPSYVEAEKAVKTISELLPHVVQDTKTVCASKDEPARAAMLAEVKALCDASESICASSYGNDSQGLNDAVSKFADASGKLVFVVNPRKSPQKRNEVVQLAGAACGDTSALLAGVQNLAQGVGGTRGRELDEQGGKLAAAAQNMLQSAQILSPSLPSRECQEAILSSVDSVSQEAQKLASSVVPLQKDPTHGPTAKDTVAALQRLENKLQALSAACKTPGSSGQDPAQEQQKLQFVKTVEATKGKWADAQKELKKPVTPARGADVAAIQSRLSDRLAALNAAVTALLAATADCDKPSYVEAEKAVKTISELLPHVVQDTKTVCASKDEPARAAMLAEVKALCDASESICASSYGNDSQGLNDAVSKFADASGKLVFVINPRKNPQKRNEVVQLAGAACGDTSALLAGVQNLAQGVGGTRGRDLDEQGGKLAAAAQNMLQSAQILSPSLPSRECQEALLSSVDSVSQEAQKLATSVVPLQKDPTHGPTAKDTVKALQRLENKLQALGAACKTPDSSVQDPAQEQQKLQFVKTVEATKGKWADAQKELKKPVTPARGADVGAIQSRLSDRLAALNAAVTALLAATADCDKPSYAEAEKAVITISELLPHVVQDTKTVCASKDEPARAAMLAEVKALCDASESICASSYGNDSQGLNDAVSKFADASGKLVFVVNPRKSPQKRNEVVQLAGAACGDTSALLAGVQNLAQGVGGTRGQDLDEQGGKLAAAAQNMLQSAQILSPSLPSRECQEALLSSVDSVSQEAQKLASSVVPLQKDPTHGPTAKDTVAALQRLENKLQALGAACKTPDSSVQDPAQEQQKLQFVKTVEATKGKWADVQKELKKPVTPARGADVGAIQSRLSDRLAALDAAVAALLAATADRDKPSYVEAEKAVKTISELLPHVVQDTKTVCASKEEPARAAMLAEVKALCDASESICASSYGNDTQGLNDAVSKFVDASGKLVFVVNPRKSPQKRNEVVQLAGAACADTSALLAVVQNLAQGVGGTEGRKLDEQGGKLATAAQNMLQSAQILSPSLPARECQEGLLTSVNNVFSEAQQLTASVAPLQKDPAHGPTAKVTVSALQRLENKLQAVVAACAASRSTQDSAQEQQKLQFIKSVEATKGKWAEAEKELKKPVAPSRGADTEAVQSRLAQRLSALDAAVAALLAATADRDKPRYSEAEKSVKTISELLPHVIQDTKTVCASKDEPTRAAMLAEIKALCDASQGICASACGVDPQGLNDAVSKYADASGKLVFVAHPRKNLQKQNEVVNLAGAACGETAALLSGVQKLAQDVGGSKGKELDDQGGILADAAQNLLQTVQVAAPSLSSPECQSALLSSADSMSHAAQKLAADVTPLQKDKTHGPAANNALASLKRLDGNLNTLKAACKAPASGVQDPAQEQQKLQFIKTVEATKGKWAEAEKELKKPVAPSRGADMEAVQSRLAQRLSALDAAVASLLAATADRDKPQYAKAEESVKTISELLPHIIQDTKTVCASKDEPARAAMLVEIKELCDASKNICASAYGNDTQGLNDAVSRFSGASGKLVYVANPRVNTQKEREVVEHAGAACGSTAALLTGVQQLAESVGGSRGKELDDLGGKVADQAQNLLQIAQITSPSLSSPECRAALLDSADSLSRSADQLSRSLSAVGADSKHSAEAKKLQSALKQLQDLLDRLKSTCNAPESAPAPVGKRPPPLPSAAPPHLAHGIRKSNADLTHDFLERMRCEEGLARAGPAVIGGVGKVKPSPPAKPAEDDKLRPAFVKSLEAADGTIKKHEAALMKQCRLPTGTGPALSHRDMMQKQSQLQRHLAQAGVEVANLVAANYADKIDYSAASKSTNALPQLMTNIVEEGTQLGDNLNDMARKAFLYDMLQMCEAARKICDAAGTDRQKLNDAAVHFGDTSTKLLYVVSSDVDPALEKEIISRAKAIGDSASRLALDAANVATAAGSANSLPASSPVQDICDAGTACVDAAGKLVYTAKLTAPSIHERACQDALVSSTDTLSTKLKSFSDSWKPLESDPQQAKTIRHLSAEASNLEKILEGLRSDVREGSIGRRREAEQLVIEDTPIRQLTVKILEEAKVHAESSSLKAAEKIAYAAYADKLTEALRALDLANARCRKTPHDTDKRRDLEAAIQNLQMILLQSRPSRGDKGKTNIVDLMDFMEEVASEAKSLSAAASGSKVPTPQDKRTLEEITEKCDNIENKANQLLRGEVPSDLDFNDLFDQFGQECDDVIKRINTEVRGMEDVKAKKLLQSKALALSESCNMLRFATKSGISTEACATLDATLDELDDIEERVIKSVVQEKDTSGVTLRGKQTPRSTHSPATLNLCREVTSSPSGVAPSAVTAYIADAASRADTSNPDENNKLMKHLYKLVHLLKTLTVTSSKRAATWQPVDGPETARITEQILQEIYNPESKFGKQAEEKKQKVLDEDIAKLLIPSAPKILGDYRQQENQLTQLASELSAKCVALSHDTIVATLPRAAKTTADVARQLDGIARGTHHTDPVQRRKIDEAAKEMSFCTYNVLKTAESVSLEPKNSALKRRLADALQSLNHSIDKLVWHASSTPVLQRQCGALTRSTAAQLAALRPRPVTAKPFAETCDLIQQQNENIYKLKSEQPMPRKEFMRNLDDIGTAVRNSVEGAAQCAYYIAVSEQHKDVAKDGVADVPQIQQSLESIQDSCMAIISCSQYDQAKEQKEDLHKRVLDFSNALDKAQMQTKDGDVKKTLIRAKSCVSEAADGLRTGLERQNSMDKVTPQAVSLLEAVNRAHDMIEHCPLVPTVGVMGKDTQERCDEVMNHSKSLLSNTLALIKDVHAAPEEPEMMTWVTFNTNRKKLLDAYDALLKTVRRNGHRAGIYEKAPEEEEKQETRKSYIESQVDLANKWLKSPSCKTEAKVIGQQAARNVIDMARQMSEDLKSSEREEIRNVITETEELLSECCKKYDHEKNSLLMDRLKELRKCIQRGVVTRVVEDFIEAEAPLADLDLLADIEQDESKRKFILERKIASLLAQLGRVTKTARFVANASQQQSIGVELSQCSEQTELLAPMLVKAAQQRIDHPDDKTVIENYKALLAQYAESISKVRDLCDRAVDPMDFVQTAGDTMQRMREDMAQGSTDAQKCAYTSNAITKLANRVINVSMSSNAVASDPELQKALIAAKARLHAVTPAPNTRASRLPDWRDTTAEILRTTGDVESALGGENIFKKEPTTANQPIYSVARDLHESVREWSSKDNEIVAVARRMAVLMARLSEYMETDKTDALISTSKSIVLESHEVAELAKKLAHECSDVRIKTNLLQTCERIPTISGQLKMLTAVKAASLGQQGVEADKEAMDMLVGNAQSLMLSIQEVVKAAAGASVKIMSQRGPRLRWVRKNYY